jgi:hypothetical protein
MKDGYTGDVAARGFARLLLGVVMCLPITHWLNIVTPFCVVGTKEENARRVRGE